MPTLPKTFLTPEEYLEIERKAETKSEYFQGEMFPMGEPDTPGDRPRRPGDRIDPMAGIGEAHSLVVGNAIASLNAQLRSRSDRVYSSGMRLFVSEAKLFTYPDVMAVHGDRTFLDERRDTLLNPSLIIEVVTPTTEAYDHGRKAEHYRTIESLRQHLLLSCDRVLAFLYTRQSDGRWLVDVMNGLEDVLQIPSVGGTLKLADLYDKVEF